MALWIILKSNYQMGLNNRAAYFLTYIYFFFMSFSFTFKKFSCVLRLPMKNGNNFGKIDDMHHRIGFNET
eukprot:UN00732